MGGGRKSGLSERSDPQKTEEAKDHYQNNYVGNGDLSSVKQLVYSANCCFNCCADNAHSTAVEEQLKQKVVQVSFPFYYAPPPCS